MAMYLGAPAKKIYDDIRYNMPLFSMIVNNLENFGNGECVGDVVKRGITNLHDNELPAVSSTVLVDYVVDPTVGPVKTEW